VQFWSASRREATHEAVRVSLCPTEKELDEELRAHLRMAVADRVERGETADEARRNAMREMGNLPLIEDVTRSMWGGVWLERVLQDVRYALRQIRRAPGFAITVVTTLALGLGATVAMYTVVDRVLLRPLPYQNSGELVKITEVGKDGELAAAYVPARRAAGVDPMEALRSE
jgi:hypothetical protein